MRSTFTLVLAVVVAAKAAAAQAQNSCCAAAVRGDSCCCSTADECGTCEPECSDSCCDSCCDGPGHCGICSILHGLFEDDGCAYYSCKPRLFGIFAPTDTRFTNFISPMTNPVYFEDPRTLTEARVIFLNHWLPQTLGGSDLQLLAVQARAALTKRLSIIATKDGYIWSGGSGPPITGWANINLGLKYNLYADARRQQLLSIGTRF